MHAQEIYMLKKKLTANQQINKNWIPKYFIYQDYNLISINQCIVLFSEPVNIFSSLSNISL